MPTYTPLQSIQLTAATSTVTFSGIPQIYQDLIVVANGYASTSTGVNLQFNGDSGSNYSATRLLGDSSSATSNRSTGQTSITVNYNGNFSDASISQFSFSILNYSNSTTYKTILSRAGRAASGVDAIVGLWRSTSAINSFSLTTAAGTFSAGATFDLYGLSPVAAQNASAAGGTDIFYDSTYVYHVFKGSGTFTPYRALTADVLVVAGGGGGGYYSWTAGGGAGGLLGFTSQSLTANTSYAVTVGGGGAANNSYIDGWPQGSNSQFGSLTAAVGGGGGASRKTGYTNGGNGGSGGGAVNNGYGGNNTGGSPTSGQGYAGGNYHTSAMAGGGGAGAAGQTPNSQNGGNGGSGLSTYSSWGLATNTGQNVSGTVYYAGGGGGGGGYNPNGSGGTGGNGGGGAGTASAADAGTATSGTTNTGGGGGGGGNGNTNGWSGSGGSGIVIVRYAR